MLLKDLWLFLLVTLLSGAGVVVGSILGSRLASDLFPGAVAGGLLGIPFGVGLAVRLGLIGRARFLPTALSAAAGFVVASVIAVMNLHTPLIPLAASALIGLGAVVGNRYLARAYMPRTDAALALIGLALAAPVLYFVSASLLKFRFGVDQPYSPLDSLLADPDRFRAFNVLSPVVFVGGLSLAVLLNLYPQLQVQVRRADKRWVATLTAEAKLLNLTVVAVGCLLVAILVVYVAFENILRF